MGYEVKMLTPWMDKTAKAELVSVSQLDDWEIRQMESDSRSYLLIFHDGELIAKFYDRGEPEDNSFGRDWSWINGALEQAYNLGVQDGSKAA